MSRINEIESKILQLGPGAYQKLMDDYLYLQFKFTNLMPLGSHSGTDKTTQGTPDSYVMRSDGKYILIMYGTTGATFKKLNEDISSSLKHCGIPYERIAEIICCHTSSNLTIPQREALNALIPCGISFTLIGLYETAYALDTRYPELALDHLSLSIDTHQILDIDTFINESVQNKLSTPLTTPLLYRDEEVESILKALRTNTVTIINGFSGVGKTRLALEVGRKFAAETNSTLKCIRANDQPIYTDLFVVLSDTQDYTVIVDDANMLSEISHLLRMASDPNRKHMLKLLMTVRDYAKGNLLHEANQYTSPNVYTLNPISSENISQILKDIYRITNQALLDHICDISKGNIRLAIMAGDCVINKNIEKILNAADILRQYYDKTLNTLNNKTMITAGIIAFFRSVKIHEEELPLKTASQLGICKEDFLEHCTELHKHEIVDMYEDAAVRFSNQNLRDYMLYYTILYRRWIDLPSLLATTYPKYKEHLSYALNTLINLFQDDNHYSYIEQSIDAVWKKLSITADDTAQFQYLSDFHNIIPEQTLLFLKEKVDILPNIEDVFSSIDDDDYKEASIIQDPIISILADFKSINSFDDAFSLMLLYLEKSITRPAEILYIFNKKWTLSPQTILHNNYKNEFLIIDTLHSRFLTSPTYGIAFCICAFCASVLKYEYSFTEAIYDHTFRFSNWHPVFIPKLALLRKKCISALGELLSKPKFHNYSLRVLFHCFFPLQGIDLPLLTSDIASIEEYIMPKLDTSELAHCVVIDRFIQLCQKNALPFATTEELLQQNILYKLYQSLNNIDPYHPDKTELEKQHITDISSCLTLDQCTLLFAGLNQLKASSIPSFWNLSEGIDILLSSFANRGKESFKDCLQVYFQHGAPHCERNQRTIEALLAHLGYKTSLQFMKSINFDNQSLWLVTLMNAAITADDTSITPTEVLSALHESQPSLPITLDNAIKLEQVQPGFLVDYLMVLNEQTRKQPNIIAYFMDCCRFHEDTSYYQNIVEYFDHHITDLYTTYITAIQNIPLFDYHGVLLNIILESHIDFIPFIMNAHLVRTNNADPTHLYSLLWKHDRYLEYITTAFDTLIADPQPYRWYSTGLDLLSQEHERFSDRQDLWFSDYIKHNYTSADKIKKLFMLISLKSPKDLTSTLLAFCQQNTDYSMFDQLPLIPTSATWSGSEIPIIESRIQSLEELRTSLHGIIYLEHKRKIGQLIIALKSKIRQTSLEEFMDYNR